MEGIRLLPHNEIDKNKWDECISSASNGCLYGSYDYLEQMSTHWDALVWKDYETVMPLTWKKKYGIFYLYQPAFCACLGVFGNNLTADLLNGFLDHIPSRFRFWDIYLNPGNLFSIPRYLFYKRVNYILDLRLSYDSLKIQYRENLTRNLRKARQQDLRLQKDIPIADIINLAKAHHITSKNISNRDYENIEKLYVQLKASQKATTYGVYDPIGTLLASAVFLFSPIRAYYILVGNHPNGKNTGASHLLIDSFILDHSGSDLILDFEGSDIVSLAFFYSSFGAQPEYYPGLLVNRLPWLFRWLKPVSVPPKVDPSDA